MAFDPMQGFEVGQKIGKSKGSAYGGTAQYMSDLTAQRDKDRSKVNPFELLVAKQALKPDKKVFSFDPETGNMVEEASLPGNSLVRNLQPTLDERNTAAIDRKKVIGAGAQSTAINAAMQAAKSARNSKQILFPDGTAASFRADIATMKSPFLGRPMLSEDAQNLAREYGIALDLYNRQVTGAAFSEKEFKQRENQFRLNLLSNPQAAFDSLNRLEELNTDYLKIADPQGIYTGNVNQGGSQQQASGMTEEQMVAKALSKNPQKKNSILAMYKQRTGKEYNG